jgi:hypothetical protein
MATSVAPLADGTFSWTVPDGWQQGRGAWGGLVIGALLRAVTAAEPDASRTVRSVSSQLAAPALVGDHVISMECVRRGAAVSTWIAALLDGSGAFVASLTAVLGSPRKLDDAPHYASWQMVEPPAVPPPDDVQLIPFRPPLGPVFGAQMAARPVNGIPTSRQRPETIGWIGYAQPVPLTAATLIALVDAWWPASLAPLPRMRPIATVAFSANLLVDPASIPLGEPLLNHAFVSAAHEGFTSEVRRLWTVDGRLAVDNLQSIVLIA